MFSKTLAVLSALALAISAAAQGIEIGAPQAGQSIVAGSNFTVEVDRPDTLTGSKEVAIVIALRPCGSQPLCDSAPAEDDLGQILYTGPFDPEFTNVPGTGNKPPHQNFSVAVPSSDSGLAVLSVVHFSLVGAGPFALLETKNITVNITSA